MILNPFEIFEVKTFCFFHIARYRIDLRNDNALALAERYYHQAIWVNPENGLYQYLNLLQSTHF